MKTKLFVFAAIFMLASCDEMFNREPVFVPVEPEFEFTASMEKAADTKTSLSYSPDKNNSHSLAWNKGDRISVSDGENTAVFSASSGYVSTTSFALVSGEVDRSAGTYSAFYPSSITPDHMVLPVRQTYVEYDVMDFPMYAYSESTHLEFKNICGILRLSINTKESTDASISSISVSSEKGMSGSFSLADDCSAVVSGNDGVVLECEKPVRLYTGSYETFNVILPPSEYESMKVGIRTSNGEDINLIAKGTVCIDRSSITHIKVTLGKFEFDSSLEMVPVIDSDVEFSER